MKIEDQSPPKPSQHRESWPLVMELCRTLRHDLGLEQRMVMDKVIADMRERDELGRERYGVALQAGNGRNHLVDAYQELQDYTVYLRTWFEEQGVDPAKAVNDPHANPAAFLLANYFMQALMQLLTLRQMIDSGL